MLNLLSAYDEVIKGSSSSNVHQDQATRVYRKLLKMHRENAPAAEPSLENAPTESATVRMIPPRPVRKQQLSFPKLSLTDLLNKTNKKPQEPPKDNKQHIMIDNNSEEYTI